MIKRWTVGVRGVETEQLVELSFLRFRTRKQAEDWVRYTSETEHWLRGQEIDPPLTTYEVIDRKKRRRSD
jgi:hypothetical protein